MEEVVDMGAILLVVREMGVMVVIVNMVKVEVEEMAETD